MREHLRPTAALLAVLSLALSSGCAAMKPDTVAVSYAEDAQRNLTRGDEALQSKDFDAAQEYYEHVRTTYPFLDAAKDAELRLADLALAREQYAEARDAYQAFIKLHPTHPKVDYAAFQSALTYVKEMPTQFFLLPPAEEKDQGSVRSAYDAMLAFTQTYKDSPLLPEAQKYADQARERLAQHELYAAEFYARRGKWPAVVRRLEGLLERYPGVRQEADAFFELHHAYVKLNDSARAQEVLRRVLSRLPNTPAAARAQRMLGS